ncbi:conserved hypothetical protein [Candidatus Zixiibacteriota bacterium]|nr:conserved hypothetical protein [candidate division Zixibacteria bacterium]
MRNRILATIIGGLLIGAVLFWGCSGDDKSTNGGGTTVPGIIADHLAIADFESIPINYIEQAKSNFKIFYGHTSHGSQIISGMDIVHEEDSLYDYNNGDGTVQISEYSDDLGLTGDTSWAPITRQRLNEQGNDINIVIWSWCGGCSDNTEEGINIYLNKMSQLEQAYLNVKFIYMTGHLDGTGPDGNLYARNNQIRQYCQTNHKWLFDFADIESYDPDGNYYPNASDACEWCGDYYNSFPCATCPSCAHSHCFNCYLKGKAFWWMLARMAGWNGMP